MANCVISIAAKTATGAVLANATITFTPLPGDRLRGQDGGVIWPNAVQVICDAGGLGSVTLKTGDYSYQTTGPQGTVLGRLCVPEAVSADLSALLATPEAYQLITWAEYQALVVITTTPFATIAAGLAGVADAALFMVAMTDDLGVYRRVGGAAVRAYTEV